MSDADERTCWICYATDEDDQFALWLRPCKCRGTTRYVHVVCLRRWIDEKQKGNSFEPVKCPQCNTQYIILYPALSVVMSVLQRFDKYVNAACPVVTLAIAIGGVYFSSLSFGALTILQVLGYDDGSKLLQEAPTTVMFIGLPLIPTWLVLAKMIRWEDAVVKGIHKYIVPIRSAPVVRKRLRGEDAPGDDGPSTSNCPVHDMPQMGPTPIVGQMVDVPAQEHVDMNVQVHAEVVMVRDQYSLARIFVGAVVMPSCSVLTGNILFQDVIETNWKRSLAGCAVFVAVKGIFRVYFKYNQLWRQAKRTIWEQPEDSSTQTHGNEGVNSGSGSSTRKPSGSSVTDLDHAQNVDLLDDVSTEAVVGVSDDTLDYPGNVSNDDVTTPQVELVETLGFVGSSDDEDPDDSELDVGTVNHSVSTLLLYGMCVCIVVGIA